MARWSEFEQRLLEWAAHRRGRSFETIKARVQIRRTRLRRIMRQKGLQVPRGR